MKKLSLLLILVSVALLSSCRTAVDIQAQEMPETETMWADTIQTWYPDWQAPIIIHTDGSNQ
ncbi:MAG: hypothetical protein HRT88_03000 [Lentisphaeraceae bacterium]|nr:hypothetical protein [Lentisphaeraceae bacterium]